jgi:hypothetical protein
MRAMGRRGVRAPKRGGGTPGGSLYKSRPGYPTRIRAELLKIKNFAGAGGGSKSIRRTSMMNARGGVSTDDRIKYGHSGVVI